jgi:hypothetical protein
MEAEKMARVISFSMSELHGELMMCADNAQPPWIPETANLSAASTKRRMPTIVVLRHPPASGDDGPRIELKFHHLSRRRKMALAHAFRDLAARLEKSGGSDDTRSLEEKGFGVDVTAALREPPAPRKR